ncbi:MAG: hypothetical protein NTW20_18280 [Rhodobacterales bacterium]|nr:hypothetical protein [Rhodobacterales bacterium]
MLLTDTLDGPSAQRLAEYGSSVDIRHDVDLALSGILNDPFGYDLFVMDCDRTGGVIGAEAAIASLIAADARMRVILVSREFDEPVYPFGRRAAVCLPVSVLDDGFRRGLDHVLRDRGPVVMM